jgi:hypothetical protein
MFAVSLLASKAQGPVYQELYADIEITRPGEIRPTASQGGGHESVVIALE